MPTLTRRRVPDASQERWRLFYGDVQVGTIGMRSGVPIHVEQWQWSCGLPLASGRVQGRDGTATDFDTARAAFEASWIRLLPTLTESNFQKYRHHRAFHAWKRATWAAGLTLPTQTSDDRARCFCGVIISNADVPEHVDAVHGVREHERQGKLTRHGRIYIEKINGPFLYESKGTPAEYKAGLLRAIEKGWLALHESGTYVKLMPAGPRCSPGGLPRYGNNLMLKVTYRTNGGVS